LHVWPTLIDMTAGGLECRSKDRKDEMLMGGLVRATWPTTRARDTKSEEGQDNDQLLQRAAESRLTIGQAVKLGLWPTAKANENDQDNHEAIKRAGSSWLGQNRGATVSTMLKATWPTPNAGGFNEGESLESWQARADLLKEKHNNGNGAGMPLGVAVKATWGTPQSMSDNPAAHSQVNGEWYKPIHPGATTSGLLALTEKFAERLILLSCWMMGQDRELLRLWPKKAGRKGQF
jgi:hypothetical protein